MSKCGIQGSFYIAPSQYEPMLQCSVVCHWLASYTKRSLRISVIDKKGNNCGRHDEASDAELWRFLFDPRPNKRLCKQSRRRWYETPSRSLIRHCNENYPRGNIWFGQTFVMLDWARYCCFEHFSVRIGNAIHGLLGDGIRSFYEWYIDTCWYKTYRSMCNNIKPCKIE